jgi:glycogen(starch) synthase
VLELMKSARVLVVPSVWHEPFGYVAVEAMACGLPVIATDAGGLRELVGPDVGRTYPAGDVAALAAHLRWAADRPEEVDRLRPAARARFETTFSSDAGYDRLVQLYELGAERFAQRQASRR